jgi:small subunit ribosomal protein S8
MVRDNIADFIVKLKNASVAGKSSMSFSNTKLIMAIAELLKQEGFLASVEKKSKKGKKLLELGLAFKEEGIPKITNVRRISKLSRRVYEKSRNLRSSRTGLGYSILSTPKGIMTDKTARKEKLGGEILFKIW